MQHLKEKDHIMYGSAQTTTPTNFSPKAMRAARDTSIVLKALSHEHRLAIMQFLLEGARSVSELEQLIGIRQSAVSQQLARLRAANIVETKREGKMVYYFIDRTDIAETIRFFNRTFLLKAVG